MRLIKTLTAVAAAVCCLTATSQATLLLPGNTASLTPQSSGGTLVSPIMTSPYFYDSLTPPPGPELNGSVISSVYLSDPLNPNGSGYLSFYYQVTTIPGGSEDVVRFTAAGYSTFTTYASTVLVGGTLAPSADRSGGGGGTIGWNFSGTGIPATGAFSDLLIVHTDAKFLSTANGSVSDGGSANVTIFAPTAVPEPTTMIAGALLLLPFGMSTLRILRKSRTA